MKIKKILACCLGLLATVGVIACSDTTTNVDNNGGGNSGGGSEQVKLTEEKVEGKTYYVSPTGVASNDGLSKNSPTTFDSMVSKVRKGDTIIMLDGTYTFRQPIQFNDLTYPETSGTAVNPITIKAENSGNVFLDFSAMEFLSTNRGLTINTDYYYIEGIEIYGAGDNGMYIGGSYNTVENCVFHDNRDTGLQLGRSDAGQTYLDSWPCNNLIKNCTSYNNYDDKTGGENADGFAAKLTVGYGNVFDGCIAYRNSDDGWDLFAKQDSGNIGKVILYNCVSFENGYLMDPEVVTDASGNPVQKVDENNQPVVDEDGNPVYEQTYRTTLGDGIGFKLGGSTMKGDVLLYNCLSFNNRLHGVGDNSNPGVISVINTTTYNNSALINEETGAVDPTISASASDDVSGNFDLARSEASYNTYSGLLSVATNNSLQADAYRGAADYSLFYQGNNNGTRSYNVIETPIDASSYVASKSGNPYEGAVDDSIFKSVVAPTGLNDPDIHSEYRNADGSINMGDFLALTDETLSKLNNGQAIGATLNKGSWDEYEHYDLTAGIGDNMVVDEARVYGAANALTLTCDANNVYQDFLLPLGLNGVSVSWVSSDYKHALVGDDVTTSNSNTEEITISITRDKEKDVNVTLTAILTYKDYSLKKDFNILIKKDEPEVGNAYLGTTEDYIILNQYERFSDPKVYVTNQASYSGQLLLEGIDYHIEKNISYTLDKNSTATPVSDVYTSRTGIYNIEYKAVSNSNAEISTSVNYTVYVINPNAQINFYGSPKVTVNRDGFYVDATLSNVKATVYVYASANAQATADEVINNGEAVTIAADLVSHQFSNANTDKYYIHMVIVNSGTANPSQVTTVTINKQNISSVADFQSLVSTTTSSTTIYSLTTDLDFTGVTFTAGTGDFMGLFNGNGHTISNLSVNGISVFGTLDGGTIMNVRFNEVDIIATATSQKVGLISEMRGGYVDHIEITNINVYGQKRIGAIVGQIHNGYSYFTEISVLNDENHVMDCPPYSGGSGQDVGGIIGFVQNDNSDTSDVSVSLSNIYVNTNMSTNNARYIGGMIGRVDDRVANVYINADHCIYSGTIHTDNYAGGLLSFTTGAGQITIDSCASNITVYKNDKLLMTCEKNISSIVGRFAINSGTGFTKVTNSYGTIGCYNYNEGDGYMVQTIGSIAVTNYETMLDFMPNTLGLDVTNVWEIVETTNGNGILKLR